MRSIAKRVSKQIKNSISILMVFALWGHAVNNVNAQTLTDVNTAWTRIVPMRSLLTSVIPLSNGNYLAYGHNSYTADPTVTVASAPNTTGSNLNEVYLVEFTETGSIVRKKTIVYNMTTSDARRYITHSRVIERADKGLLITSEHEHGAGFTTDYRRFMRVILPPTWTETSAPTSNGVWGIQLAWNGYTWIIPTRMFSFTRTNDGKILAGFNGLKNKNGVNTWIKGCIFLDDNGDPVGGASAFHVIEEEATSGTIVTITKNGTGTKYTFGQDAATVYESTDLNCTAFNTFQDRLGGYRMYSATVRPLFNNAGEYYHIGTSGSMNAPYNDAQFQIMAWRWDANRNIKTPNPYWTWNDMSIGGQILLNPSGVTTYDRILTTIATTPAFTNNFDKAKIAEFKFSSTEVTLTQGNYLNTPTNTALGFHIPSTIKDGIIGGGGTTSGEKRMVLAKFSLCANFKVDQLSNQTYFSGIPTSLYKYTPTGAFAGATVTSEWKMTLISGALLSHPTAVAGTVLYSGSNPSGTQTTIPSQTFSVNGDARAVVSVEYTAKQEYGSPNSQICNTSGQFNIVIQKAPDNVSDALCFIPPTSSEWGIKEAFSFTGVHSMSTPLVADLDGVLVNGKRVPEIVVPRTYGIANPWSSDGFIIGNTTAKTQHTITTAIFRTHGQSVAIADVDGDGEATIFLQGLDFKIYAYHGVTGALKTGYPSTALAAHYIISIADINNDGRPEILAGQQIYDAQSGTLILNVPFVSGSGGFGNPHMGTNLTDLATPYYMPVLGDIDGDGTLEMVAASTVYKINITNATGTAGNSYSIFSTAATGVPGMATNYDGATVLVDFDGDGDLDVCVLGHSARGRADLQFYVWDGQTSEIIAYAPRITSSYASIPYVGDLDDDGYPSFCFSSKDGMTNYSFDKTKPGNIRSGLTYPVGGAVSDLAETSGFTLFDFNADGKKEIVYRGREWFHILDGATLAPLSPKTQSWSGTVAEYPIVADVDGDGSAEIILTHANVKWESANMDGKVTVYKSDKSGGWAPARPVWNQWAYNSVLINDNMTVPKFSMNPATIFPGDDGVLGNDDDVRPFNGFLQQQSSINKNGTLLFLAANAVIPSQPVFQYDPVSGTMTISVTVENQGNTALQAPFYITVYKDAVGNATKYPHTHSSNINVGSSAVITFTIPTFKTAWIPFTSIVVRANDSGNGLSNQAVCSEAQRDFKTGTVIASDDRVLVFKNSTGNIIKILENDIRPAACVTPSITTISGPKHGTVDIGAYYTYKPNADYLGQDTIIYKIDCSGKTSIAKVIINVVSKPDNISDAECYVEAPAGVWGIKESLPVYKTHKAHNYMPLLVGDIDGDGKVEIVTADEIQGTGVSYYPTTGLKLFNYDGTSIQFKNSFKFATVGGPLVSTFSSMAMARHNGQGYIVTSGGDGFLWAYSPTGVKLWKSGSGGLGQQAMIGIADFNNDGVPEVYAGNKVFSLLTGASLCTGTGNYGLSQDAIFTVAADIDNDGQLELFAGTQIYKVNIAAGTMSEITALTLPTTALPVGALADGITQVADIDLDGKLEVLVTSRIAATGKIVVYVWKPELNNSKLLGSYTFTGTTTGSRFGVSMIGNIDADKYPEIVLIGNTPDLVYALKYDATKSMGSRLVEKWTLGHTDGSGCTGMSLFDFDLNGRSEIVYRDQTMLRLIDGSGATPVVLAKFEDVKSGTLREHPIVADLDGDGTAEIVVTGDLVNQGSDAYLRVFKSSGSKWAPARKVWNQYAYNAVNINDDLTIPHYQLNPATVFPGKDGMLGTADDVRPYNAFLQQQTTLNKNGTPLWLTPNAEIGVPTPIFNYSAVGDSMQIKLVINNVGDAALQAPVKITVYKDAEGNATKYTYAYPKAILAGASATISFAIPNFRTWLGATNSSTQLIVKINDKGDGANDQAVCADTKVKYTKPYGNLLMANTDHASGFTNKPITEKVLSNDSTATCTRGTLTKFDTIPASGLKNGKLVIHADSTFTYTPKLNFVGMDSVTYYIKCGADSSAAKVYFMIVKPNALAYTACPNAVVTVGVNAIAGVTFRWYTTATGGIIPAHSLTAIVTKDASSTQSVWVEAEYKGVKYSRIEIKVNLSPYCGLLTPEGCGKDGTLLYREDFGGNNDSDPRVSPVDLIGGRSDLLFNGVAPGSGNYGLVKYQDYAWALYNDDHTKPDDRNKGYYMYIDPAPSQMNAKLYEYDILGLCQGTSKLNFTVWMVDLQIGQARPKVEMLILNKQTGDTLVTSGVFILPRQSPPGQDIENSAIWRQYGFEFALPTGISDITFRLTNKEVDNAGNDWAMDDIEIRFCAPPVVTLPAKDTVICLESNLDIQLGSEFIDDGTFGANLDYRWEFKAQESLIWNIITDTEGSSSNGKVTVTQSKHTIASATAASTGDYRFIIAAQGNINSVNCRAVSESFHVLVAPEVRAADIRVQVCPDATPGSNLNLSSYLHVIHPQLDWNVKWGNVSATPYSPVVSSSDPKGAVSLAFATGTHTYKYKMENKCGVDSARVYITSLNTTTIQMPPQRVVICREMAENIHINQILGVEARGVITSNLTPAIANDHILNVASPSPFAGAVVFNGKTAYDDTRITPDPYKGDVKATRVVFTYTANNASCLTQKVYTVELIITTNILN